jgi:hypothetical protein
MATGADARRLAQIRRRMTDKALELLDSLDAESLSEAPFHQRAAALGSLIDRLLKLYAFERQNEAPDSAHEGQVIRIEYRYPDGTTHRAPPWAAAGTDGPDAVLRGGLRSALGEDGTGESAAD